MLSSSGGSATTAQPKQKRVTWLRKEEAAEGYGSAVNATYSPTGSAATSSGGEVREAGVRENVSALRRFVRVVATLASDFSRDVVGFALNNPLNNEGHLSWFKKDMVAGRRYEGGWSTLLNPFDGFRSEFRGGRPNLLAKACLMFIGMPFDFRSIDKGPHIGLIYYPYFAVRVVAGALLVGFRWTIGAGIQALSRQKGFGWLASPIQGARYLAAFFDGAIQVLGLLAHTILILPATPFVWAAVKIDRAITKRHAVPEASDAEELSFENPSYRGDCNLQAEADNYNNNAPLYTEPVPVSSPDASDRDDLQSTNTQGDGVEPNNSAFQDSTDPVGGAAAFGSGEESGGYLDVASSGDDENPRVDGSDKLSDPSASAVNLGNQFEQSLTAAQPSLVANVGLFMNSHDPRRPPYNPLDPYDSVDRHDSPRQPMSSSMT